MLDYSLAFDSPWFLALLALVPLVWLLTFRSLSGLGGARRLLALAVRTVVLVLIVMALAEAQYVRTSDRMTVIYVLDESLSVPEADRRWMTEYVNASVAQHRDREREDRAGVVVFGREAAVEVPPYDFELKMPPTIESTLDPQYSNLAGAMKLARALFPHDSSKRLVLLTDGNENLGDARQQARALVESGVGIDVVPIHLASRGEVAVEKLILPSDVRRGQPFNLRVVLNRDAPESNPAPIGGKLRIVRKSSDREETLAAQDIELPPGKRVLTVREEIDQPDFYTYEARFIPDDPASDAMPQNNRGTTFTYVRGRGQVLLIEDWQSPGEFDHLVERLRNENLEVTVQPSDQLFSSLAELQRYDTVILANVPRSSGENANNISHFSDEQIDMLVQNTHELGSGLIMMGGPNSFGAGGWTNTELEKAMPVDFQVKSPKVVPVGALALVIDRSGSMSGEKIELSKVAAVEAAKVMGPRDSIGVVAFDTQAIWTVPMQPVQDPARIANMIGRLTSSGGTNMYPAMLEAHQALQNVDASVKHMILLTDGHTNGTGYVELARQARRLKMTVSCVAIGVDAEQNQLMDVAQAGGGKFYSVQNPAAIPRIFIREARRIARPLILEDPGGMTPQMVFPHEMIKGVSRNLPPITGLVLTTVKSNNLVEVSLASPKPTERANATILASWTYGLGKAVAWTTDAGRRWATQWTGWENYDKLFSQIVRWSMRPTGDGGKFTLASDVRDGKAQLVVTALDQDDTFLNFLSMAGSVVGPDMEPIDVDFRQTAPGRYVGEFDAQTSGSYFVIVNPGAGQTPLRTGINVGYSDEFRDRETNEPLLRSLAGLTPTGGQPGQYIDQISGADAATIAEINPFRRDLPKATASQDIWHLLVLGAACLFFADVFVRRVHVDLAWVAPLAVRVRERVLRRQQAVPEGEVMSRLRSRKAQIGEQIEQRRASTRFEPVDDVHVQPGALQEQGAPSREAKQPAASSARGVAVEEVQPEQETYTSRLLKAKKQVWEERNKEKR